MNASIKEGLSFVQINSFGLGLNRPLVYLVSIVVCFQMTNTYWMKCRLKPKI